MQKIFDYIIDAMAFLAGLLLVGSVLIMSLEVGMRYFFGRPQVWTIEVSEYILFTLTFLATPWLLKKGGHIGVDIVVERVGPKFRTYLELFSSGLGVLVSGIIAWFSALTAWECYETGVVVTKTLTVPKHYFLEVIVLGYTFLLLTFARQFYQQLKVLKGED
jgi:TRAP-type C4-dicarboxylate transport system permease small subunit